MRAARGGRDRGAVIVETALVAPLFFLLVFGIIEFGLVFRDYTTATAAVSDAARLGAIIGPGTVGRAADAPSAAGPPASPAPDVQVNADYEIIRSVRDGLAGLSSTSLRNIIIFKGTAAAGDPTLQIPAQCLAGTAVAGRCNVYDPTEAFGAVASGDPDFFDCVVTPASPACTWDPRTRNAGPDPADIDYLGVYVAVDRPGPTGLFQDRYAITEAAVVRLEPGKVEE